MSDTTPQTKSTKITATDRYSIEKLITDKGKNVAKALSEEISGDRSAVRRSMLEHMGILEDSNTIYYRIRDLKRQLEDVDYDEDQQLMDLTDVQTTVEAQIENELEEITRKLRDDLDDLERAYKKAVAEKRAAADLQQLKVRNSRQDRSAEIEAKIAARRAEVLEEQAPGVQALLDEAVKSKQDAERAEREVDTKLNSRMALLEKSKSRLVQLVNDAVVQARQQLIIASSLEEAYKLIDAIPTVAEVISIAEDPEAGLASLVARLHPTHRIALPAPTVEAPPEDEKPEPLIVVQAQRQVQNVTYADEA